jgi:hypothetical protein
MDDGWPTAADEEGAWLVAHRWEIDRGELGWLEALASFDRDQGWSADGQLSCVDWLMWQTKMARATAYEKLRIAHEMRRRPLVRDAFAAGRLSYSAVRVITRIEGPDPDVDSALIDLAEAGSVAELERATHISPRYQDQDRPPCPISHRRGLRICRRADGVATVEVVLEASQAEELAAGLQLMMAGQAVDESPAGDTPDVPVDESPLGDTPAEPVDESPAGDNPPPLPADERSTFQRRADAFMDLVRIGLAHAGGDQAVGPTSAWFTWSPTQTTPNCSTAPC